MGKIESLKPERVFDYFEEISRIPRGSGNTGAVSEYLQKFAEDHKLECVKDDAGNVIIEGKASAGYEKAPCVILQGHIDMVCAKTPDSTHDFTKDPIELKRDGDYLYAQGTSLGGDDGIGAAYILAILDDGEIAHPPIEAVFTVDEETGMLGASALDGGMLSGKIMINLDSEKEGTMIAGCAGGLRIDSVIPVTRAAIKGVPVMVTMRGLLGGHSGEEINKNRINADKLIGRYLYELDKKAAFSLADLSGGDKDNAIPNEAKAHLVMDEEDFAELAKFTEEFQNTLRKEYAGTDDGLEILVEKGHEHKISVLEPGSQDKVIFFLNHTPYGVRKMSAAVSGLVETSCNLGIMKSGPQQFVATTSIRSSVESERTELTDEVETLTEFLGGTFIERGMYPAWELKKDSKLRDAMQTVYKGMYGKELEVAVIHAGLECGLFSDKIADLDAVSIGPDMLDIHTANEKLSIASTARVWDFLCNVLSAIM
ncbi:MAG TPA: aminoacyl-histidine dipeptidase [Lachnospiraceae bacterium]|nr:aminoacyl-histidine dipeptidase [Lachnospiraceae bacterium]